MAKCVEVKAVHTLNLLFHGPAHEAHGIGAFISAIHTQTYKGNAGVVLWDFSIPLKRIDFIMALSEIKDENLHLALHMAFVCSLRIGEAMAATWDCIDLEKGEFYVTKTLQRATKEAVDMLPKDNLYFVFPAKMEDKKSVLILKKPKTKSSTRVTYLTGELCEELRQHKERLNKRKDFYGEKYRDYNLVFALENGYPVEPKLCEKWFKQWMQKSEYKYPDIVFHSIRHSSTTYKLIISGGDIKEKNVSSEYTAFC